RIAVRQDVPTEQHGDLAVRDLKDDRAYDTLVRRAAGFDVRRRDETEDRPVLTDRDLDLHTLLAREDPALEFARDPHHASRPEANRLRHMGSDLGSVRRVSRSPPNVAPDHTRRPVLEPNANFRTVDDSQPVGKIASPS